MQRQRKIIGGGHTSKKNIYFEKNNGDIVYLQSSYEIAFATILEEKCIDWSRPEPLIWVDCDNKDHRYYPDFKINGIYFDTKNDYLVIKDADKIDRVRKQNNVNIIVVVKDNINYEFIMNHLKTS